MQMVQYVSQPSHTCTVQTSEKSLSKLTLDHVCFSGVLLHVANLKKLGVLQSQVAILAKMYPLNKISRNSVNSGPIEANELNCAVYLGDLIDCRTVEALEDWTDATRVQTPQGIFLAKDA